MVQLNFIIQFYKKNIKQRESVRYAGMWQYQHEPQETRRPTVTNML